MTLKTMKKLWQKEGLVKLNKKIEAFDLGPVENHPDNQLVTADVYGSLAHAQMLQKIGLLTKAEFVSLKKGLLKIKSLCEAGEFKLKPGEEDIHTKIENYLTKNYGQVGKKIHTARSRNDQVLLDTRIHTKEKLIEVSQLLLSLCSLLTKFARKYEFTPVAGYTHMKKAMPSSIGLWASSFSESLLDDLKSVKLAYELSDQSPLGSAASYGVSLPIDRKFVADLLGFARVQNNVLYCQNSRGKIEAAAIFAFCEIAQTLSKLAEDVLLFTTEEFGYLKVSPEFTTGSSIMPQKQNLDVMELVRGKAHVMYGYLSQTLGIISGLPSGYNKDTAETKEILVKSFELIKSLIESVTLVLESIQVDEVACKNSLSKEIYATQAAYLLVRKGMPFRPAYKKVARSLNKIPDFDALEILKSSTHLGGTGNLGLENIFAKIKKEKTWWKSIEKKYAQIIEKLKGGGDL